jgi:hypothetical protein
MFVKSVIFPVLYPLYAVQVCFKLSQKCALAIFSEALGNELSDFLFLLFLPSHFFFACFILSLPSPFFNLHGNFSLMYTKSLTRACLSNVKNLSLKIIFNFFIIPHFTESRIVRNFQKQDRRSKQKFEILINNKLVIVITSFS